MRIFASRLFKPMGLVTFFRAHFTQNFFLGSDREPIGLMFDGHSNSTGPDCRACIARVTLTLEVGHNDCPQRVLTLL
jgi:hypothetical protein